MSLKRTHTTSSELGDERGHGRAKRLAYDRCGQGEPLVLLHPLGADRTVWRPVLGLLRPHRDVLCVDLPGFGESRALEGRRPPTPSLLAVAVVQLLTELGIDDGRAHLAGNSLGGWVALEAAAAGHAASVTAIAPAGLWPQPLLPKPQLGRALARVLAPAAGVPMRSRIARRLVLASTVAHPERVPPDQAAALVRSYAGATGFGAVSRAMRAGTFTRLAEIEVRVTLAWPQHDRMVARPKNVPDTVCELSLPGCGHVPMWDDSDAVASVLLSGSDLAQ